jgi:nucleoside-diphosphate-sugar epimerase
MNVVVTGATGFVAGHLIPRLAAEGHRVYAAGHDAARLPQGDGVTPVVWDSSQPISEGALPEHIDAVAHLVQANVSFPDRAVNMFEVNAGSAVRLLDYGRRAGAARFVFTSSGSVYGGGDRPWREDDPPQGRDFYAATKIAAERAVLAFAPHFGTSILRLFAPYGPGQERRMVPGLIARVTSGQAVTVKEGRGPRFNPLYIADVVEVIVQALSAEGHQLVNVGGDEALSIRDMAETIGRVVGREAVVEDQPGEIGGDFVGDTARLRQTFRLPARLTTFEEGVRAMVAAQSTRG